MNKADIDEAIKWFATYCNKPLEFGGNYKIDNTGMLLEYRIKIKKDEEKLRK